MNWSQNTDLATTSSRPILQDPMHILLDLANANRLHFYHREHQGGRFQTKSRLCPGSTQAWTILAVYLENPYIESLRLLEVARIRQMCNWIGDEKMKERGGRWYLYVLRRTWESDFDAADAAQQILLATIQSPSRSSLAYASG